MASSQLIHANPNSDSTFTDQLTKRINFLGITLLALILNFVIFFLLNTVFGMVSTSGIVTIFLYWISLAISTFCAIIFAIVFTNRYIINDPTRSIPIFECLHFNEGTIGSQLKWTIGLLCIFYVPLDFLFYLLPGMLEYSAINVTSSSIGIYFTWALPYMIATALIVHILVAFREEWFFRHFIISAGQKKIGPATAFIYSGLLFGIGHFYYILSPVSQEYSSLYPFLWGLSACYIGFVSGYFFLKKKQLWPIIFAHWLNNVISAIAIHNHLDGIPFIDTTKYLYLPLMILGLGFLIINRKRFLTAFHDLIQIIKHYNIENANLEVSEKSNPTESQVSTESKKQLTTEQSISMLLLDVFIMILISIGTLLLF